MYNCKKVVALILAAAVKCAFAFPDNSVSDASGQIKLDSLKGYTFERKYTFDDFQVDGTNHYRQYTKKLSPRETLYVYALEDGRVYAIEYRLYLSNKLSASEKLSFVQQVVAELQKSCILKLKFSKEKTTDGEPLSLWVCEDCDRRLFVWFVHNENSSRPRNRNGVMRINLSSKKLLRQERDKATQ